MVVRKKGKRKIRQETKANNKKKMKDSTDNYNIRKEQKRIRTAGCLLLFLVLVTCPWLVIHIH